MVTEGVSAGQTQADVHATAQATSYASPAGGMMGGDLLEIDPRDYLAILWRHGLTIGITIAIVVGATVLYSLLEPEVYEARIRLFRTPQRPPVGVVDARTTSVWRESSLESDRLTVTSDGVLNAVAQRLRTTLPTVAEQVTRNRLASAITTEIVYERANRPTNHLDVTVQWWTEEGSNAIASALGEAFRTYDQQIKVQEVQAVVDDLTKKREETLRDLAAIEDRVIAYNQSERIVKLSAKTQTLLDRAAMLEAKVQETDLQISSGRRLIEALQAQYDREQDQTVSTTVRRDPRETQLLELRVKLSEAQARLTDKHPTVLALQASIQDLERQISMQGASNEERTYQPNEIRQQLYVSLVTRRGEMQALESNREGLARAFEVARAELTKIPDWEKHLAEMERSRRILEETLKAQSTSLAAFESIQDSTVSSYQISTFDQARRIRPDHVTNGLVGVLTALLLGFLVTLVLEWSDVTIKSPAEIRRRFKLSTLVTIPAFDRREGGALIDPADPRSSKVEVFRLLRNNIYYAFRPGRQRSVLVASSVQGEGKSAIALNLAAVTAMEGQKVMLVSADLRRGTTDRWLTETRLMETAGGPGLTEYLEGTASARDVVRKGTLVGLYAIPSGSIAHNASRLLASPRMRELLARLEQTFDLVVIDVPATLPIVDSTVISGLVDGVLIVVSAEDTPRGSVSQTIERLRHVNSHLLGVALNKVRPSAPRYGSTYYGYYSDHA